MNVLEHMHQQCKNSTETKTEIRYRLAARYAILLELALDNMENDHVKELITSEILKNV